MTQVARLTDQTTHGTPLTSTTGIASPTVTIGTLQAWRMSDVHICPLTMPNGAPHVGGSVSLGSPTVRVNGTAAARQGDTIVEAGPPNSIAMGCPTVQMR